jgi:hypothetical protein
MKTVASAVLMAIALLSATPASAQQENGTWRKTIIVATLDGTTMEYLIDQNTKVRIEKPNLVVETEGVVLNFELENMSQVRYGQRWVSAISQTTMDNGQPFKWDNETIFFDNLPKNTQIEVIAADGKQVMSRQLSGETQLSLDKLTNGVYLVKVNQTTYKIIKR